ncbi:hypothetical protein R69608_07364 [Paraburkholderia nemoris]|uniref:DUF3311 domain-containing protein n=1 Tax=Paraburkholderia nemoris TaxID=2793076 RepID=UPI001912223B|nr:DUF3311 domain-containing protein [Paraburkholderia nemoris]MBK5152869.1 DUF3311 domain-containing protein [Burkholderia sp. R-69608]CAE6970439.1 hypothetical protein R69608_07364 [Paraburkholderia nemoris]
MKKIYLLGVIPPLLNIVGAVFSRSAEPYVFGVPSTLAWVVGCVLVTSIVMQTIYVLDRRSSEPGCTNNDRNKEAQ